MQTNFCRGSGTGKDGPLLHIQLRPHRIFQNSQTVQGMNGGIMNYGENFIVSPRMESDPALKWGLVVR